MIIAVDVSTATSTARETGGWPNGPARPGTYVESNDLQRDTDADFVNHEAGEYHQPS